MYFQIASDLHLEFPDNRNYLQNSPIIPKADILLLGGDIMPIHKIDARGFKNFIDYFSDHFEKTYWIPGNHEFYGGDLSNYQGSFKEDIRTKVHLLNNNVIMEGNSELIMSTLWTKISKRNLGEIRYSVNDYRNIGLRKKTLEPEDTTKMFEENLKFLESSLAKQKKAKRIVLTHHVPTLQNYPPKYKGDVLNEAFTVDIDNLITGSDIDYWVFGHHHFNVPSFKLGCTTMLTNQLGYVLNAEHKGFNDGLVI